MTSNNSCSSEHGDFFDSLEESLTVQYSSYMLADFILNLSDAINELDDDTEDGFCFYDNDEYNNVDEYFRTSPSVLTGESDEMDDKENDAIYKNETVNLSVDMFDESNGSQDVTLHERETGTIFQKETDNLSVDMFAEFEEIKEVDSDSECVDGMSLHVENPRKTLSDKSSARLCHVSNDILNVEVSEKCDQSEVTLCVERAKNRQLSEEPPKMNEPEPEEKSNHQKESDSIKILCLPSISSINEPENWGTVKPDVITSNIASKDIQRSSIISSDFSFYGFPPQNVMPPTVRNLNVEVSEKCKQSKGTLCVDHATNQQLSEEPPKLKEPEPVEKSKPQEESDSIDSMILCLPSISSINEHENWETLNTDLMTSIIVSKDIQRPSIISSDFSFYGFPPQNVMPQTVRNLNCSPKVLNNIGSDLNTTICEEYETTNNFIPQFNTDELRSFDLGEAYTQCLSEGQNGNSDADRRQKLIDEIEKLILRLNNNLMCDRKLVIEVPYRVTWDNCMFENERLILRPLPNGETRKISSNRSISMVLYVLSFVYKLLLKNTKCTKREIYYSDPDYTQNQESVDHAVRDICLILNARPWEINILSSSKGLIAGSIRITLNDDTILDVGSIDGGILLPHLTTSVKKVETAAKFIILVEKHTIYEKLLAENILNQLGPCVLITGKGYPDTNTKSILKRIWNDCKCPIYALVDADPYGIEIMLSYRHGSLNMSYGNEDLAIPSIRWIGVYPSEIKTLRLQSLPLTKEDLCRINGMIKRPYISTKVYKELLVMKTTLQKSEVEGLTSSGIVDWIDSYLRNKIQSGIFM